jgi:hypothetical protein
MKTHRVCGILLIIIVSLGLGALPALADQIQIHVTGLNFRYDGSDIYDSVAKAGGNYNTAEADPLTTIDFFKNNAYRRWYRGIRFELAAKQRIANHSPVEFECKSTHPQL